jgi:hypothetical protein
VQSVYVYVLGPDPARELLLRRSGLPDSEPHRAAADKVAKELGCLPLALEHAAAYVEQQAIDFDRYLEIYETHHREVLERPVRGGTQYPDSIAATWLASVRRLSPPAQSVLTLVAFLAADDIPRELVMQARDLAQAGITDLPMLRSSRRSATTNWTRRWASCGATPWRG